VPTIAILVPGTISIHSEAGDVQKYFVSSGTATIHADSSVQILAEEICAISDIDEGAVRAGLEAAQGKLSSASNEADKAAAQIEIDVYQSMMAAA
jgi:F-type H+-transporting ATPase subunit delta